MMEAAEQTMMEDTENRIADFSSPTVIDVIDLTKESPRTRPSRSHQRRTIDISVDSPTEASNYYYVCTYRNTLSSNVSVHTQNSQMKKSTKRTKIHSDEMNANKVMTLDDTVEGDNKHYTIESDNRTPISLMCPICFEALSSNLKPTTTRCGHIFCAECLETFLRTSKKCPTCKSAVTLKSCTRLYL